MTRKRTVTFTAALALLTLAATSASLAQHGEMSAEEQEMMKKWEAAATPGPQHREMAKLVGNWKLKVKHWMDPAAPPMESEATAKYEAVMDGRYVVEHVSGEGMDGQTFRGMGLQGYDNLKKKYVSTWIDNMSTSVMMMEGTCDAAGTCTFTGEQPDFMTGGTKKVRSVVKHVSDTQFVFEMYEPGADGKQFKSMEITYTR